MQSRYAPQSHTVLYPTLPIPSALEGLLGSGHLTVGGKYEFADSISSLGAGIFQQINIRVVERPFTTAVGLFPYKYHRHRTSHTSSHLNHAPSPHFAPCMRRYIYDHYGQRLGTPLVGDVDSVLAWVLTFAGIDFAYYWFHRGASVVESRALRASPSLTAPSPLPVTLTAGHEINFIWASHSVHHSSEHYNLTTALRQSAIQSWFKLAFYLPLAFLFPVPVYVWRAHWVPY